jgi:HAD superfamily hydrolase (TIGR01509 family)
MRRNHMYVIFDMDGVIVDSEAVYLAGYLHAARLYDLPIEDMRAAVGRAVGVVDAMERAIMTETFGHLPQFSLDKTYKACRDYFNNAVETGQIDLKPGAAEILQSLRNKNIPVGLASSSPRTMIEKVLKRHGVLQYFDVVISGDMVQKGKPDPEIFLLCADALGIPVSKYSETFVIEDSHNGIRAAYAAGMRPIMVPDQLPPTQEMREKAVAILPSLIDAAQWLELT